MRMSYFPYEFAAADHYNRHVRSHPEKKPFGATSAAKIVHPNLADELSEDFYRGP